MLKDIVKWPYIFHNILEDIRKQGTILKTIPVKIGFNYISLKTSFELLLKKEKLDLPSLWLFSSSINYFQVLGYESKIIWLIEIQGSDNILLLLRKN